MLHALALPTPHTGKDMALLHRHHARRIAAVLPSVQPLSGPDDQAQRQLADVCASFAAIFWRARELNSKAWATRSLYNAETLQDLQLDDDK